MIVVPPVGRLINLCAHAFIKAGETSCSIPLKPSCCHRQRGVHSRERSCNPRLSGWQSAQREKHHMRASAFHSSFSWGLHCTLSCIARRFSCASLLNRVTAGLRTFLLQRCPRNPRNFCCEPSASETEVRPRAPNASAPFRGRCARRRGCSHDSATATWHIAL